MIIDKNYVSRLNNSNYDYGIIPVQCNTTFNYLNVASNLLTEGLKLSAVAFRPKNILRIHGYVEERLSAPNDKIFLAKTTGAKGFSGMGLTLYCNLTAIHIGAGDFVHIDDKLHLNATFSNLEYLWNEVFVSFQDVFHFPIGENEKNKIQRSLDHLLSTYGRTSTSRIVDSTYILDLINDVNLQCTPKRC